MRRILLGLTIILANTFVNGQDLTIESLISLAQNRTNLNTDTISLCELYVIDGIPYTTEQIEEKLGTLQLSDIKLATIADLSSSQIYCRICDYMLLAGTGANQSRKYKLKQLEIIRSNLNEHIPEPTIKYNNCEDCRQLVVNGNSIEPPKARELVNELKPKDIQFIVNYQAANPETYGRNAVNGLTEIFLK